MIHTRSALPVYLYGYEYDWRRDDKGRLIVTPKKVATHRWGEKEIPSGFFNLPGAENISAVVFSNSGTISKFNRMGVLAGFGSRRVVLTRAGSAYDRNPDSTEPRQFVHVVGAPGYNETWVEGLDVFHNPRAKHPLDPEVLPGAGHHRLLDDGRLQSVTPEWHPLVSMTHVLVVDSEDDARRMIQETA